MRRKGELSGNAVDREWPYQVALPGQYVSAHHETLLRRAKELAAAPRGHTFVRDGQYWVTYCFATEEQAAAFHAHFGGARVTPDDRPRWPGKFSPKELRERRNRKRERDPPASR